MWGAREDTWIMVARGRPRELIRPRPRCILNSIEVYMKAYVSIVKHMRILSFTPEHSSTQTGTIKATATATADTFRFRFAAKFGRIFSGAVATVGPRFCERLSTKQGRGIRDSTRVCSFAAPIPTGWIDNWKRRRHGRSGHARSIASLIIHARQGVRSCRSA